MSAKAYMRAPFWEHILPVGIGPAAALAVACPATFSAPALARPSPLLPPVHGTSHPRSGPGRVVTSETALVNAFELAVRNDAIALAYQPIVSASNGKVISYEALARWTHPQLGEVPPKTFIPLAERLGLISVLGRNLLRRACNEAARWPEHVSLTVNVSPYQLERTSFATMVVGALATSTLEPGRLVLEISERAQIADPVTVAALFSRLRCLGLRIAIDDLGTGRSTIEVLNRYPIDAVKIDRSVVVDPDKFAINHAILRSMVRLARDMELDVVAEGVETQEQFDRLEAAGCTHAQGYLFGKPLPCE